MRDAFRGDMLAAFAACAGVAILVAGRGLPPAAYVALAAVSICAATDISSGYVYNAVTYPSLCAVFAAAAAAGSIESSVLWAGGTLAAGIIVHMATRGRVIGLGDVKLLSVVAGGVSSAIGFVVAGSFVLGACALSIALMRGRISLREKVAFAPYIAAATIVVAPVHGLMQ